MQLPTRHSFVLLQVLLSHSPIKFYRNTSKGPYHNKGNLYISQFPQSSDLFSQILGLSHLFFSFSSTLTSAGTAISIIIPKHLCLTVLWSLHSLLLLREYAHTTFHCILTCSFYKYPNQLSFQHCRVVFFWANVSHPLVICCTLSPFFPHNLHRGYSLVLSMWYFI